LTTTTGTGFRELGKVNHFLVIFDRLRRLDFISLIVSIRPGFKFDVQQKLYGSHVILTVNTKGVASSLEDEAEVTRKGLVRLSEDENAL
jgi:hypothetical protein